jgi:hypothetical protein
MVFCKSDLRYDSKAPTEVDLVGVHLKNIYCVPANNLKNSEVFFKKWQKSTFLRVDERKN